MSSEGYIKLYRRMMQWGWYTDQNTKGVFLHLLFLAQYEPCFYRGVWLQTGQAVSTLREISAQTGISVQSVRTALRHLKSTQEITQTPKGRFCIFTLQNYAQYQGVLPAQPADGSESTDSLPTHSEQPANTQPTHTLILRNQKIKNSRREEKTPPPQQNKKSDILPKQPYGEFQNVYLTGAEYEKLTRQLGQAGAKEYIERLSAYLEQDKQSYKSHYAALLSWWRRDGRRTNRVLTAPPQPAKQAQNSAGEDLFGPEPPLVLPNGG
ncbi:MAG: hypothetical protein MSH10_05140 [Pygmaiobacter massiliensis]|nr:hypothetical protein [Pygmaiobacter massiliensis]